MTRLEFYEKWVWVHIAITVASFLGLFAIGFRIDAVGAILLGVLANLITSLIFYAYALKKVRTEERKE